MVEWWTAQSKSFNTFNQTRTTAMYFHNLPSTNQCVFHLLYDGPTSCHPELREQIMILAGRSIPGHLRGWRVAPGQWSSRLKFTLLYTTVGSRHGVVSFLYWSCGSMGFLWYWILHKGRWLGELIAAGSTVVHNHKWTIIYCADARQQGGVVSL